MRAPNSSALGAAYSRPQQPPLRPAVHLNSTITSSSRLCAKFCWQPAPRQRLHPVAAGRKKGAGSEDEGEITEVVGEVDTRPAADIKLSPEEYEDLFDGVEEDAGEDVDLEQEELLRRLAPSDDEQEMGAMYKSIDDGKYVDSDGEVWELSDDEESSAKYAEEDVAVDDPAHVFSIDDLIQSENVDPSEDPEGNLGDFEPSDIYPEGADTLGGMPYDMPEPERAFDYPEPPERKMLFSELLEKCGYEEEVIDQYTDVGDTEITGIATDSRRLQSGELFVCIEGAHADGHHFIPHAISQGTPLIIAKLMVPGAELALYTDADPMDEDLAHLYQEPFYRMAENDKLTMDACSDEMTKWYDKAQGFGQKNRLKEADIEDIQMAGAMRCISSALNYNFDHWERFDGKSEQDEDLTPHPMNMLVPMEINTPVTFAIDPSDFVGTLAHHFYDRPSERMTTVGVTGTNGKTTVAWLMRSVFEQMGKLTGMIGTVEYALATDRLDLDGYFWEDVEKDTTLNRECSAPFWAAPYEGKYSVPCTTPDNVSVQKIMAGMADRGATACVMECSSIGLHQGRVENVDFDVAIFTNLGRDHLDYHEGDVEEYMNTKALLFDSLHDPERQRAIINLDDRAAETMAEAARNVPMVTYSLENPEADVKTTNIKFSIWETELTIETPLGLLKIVTPLIGRPNVYNILACVAACISIGIELSVVVQALENAEIVPGRFELIDEGQEFVTMVDYAHTPDALNALLDTVRECSDCKRIILVFGCGGDRDQQKRPFMGEIAHYKADIVILTNDNPRTEPPEDIIEDIVDGFPEEVTQRFETTSYDYMVDVGRVPPIFEQELLDRQGEVKRYVIEDRFCAIRAAIAIGQKNDVVIIAGKGHEDYIEYGDVDGGTFKAWFDDRVEARNALSKLPVLDRIPYLQRKNLPLTRTK